MGRASNFFIVVGSGGMWAKGGLRSTTELRSLLRGVFQAHLQLPRAALDKTVLPGSAGLPARPRSDQARDLIELKPVRLSP